MTPKTAKFILCANKAMRKIWECLRDFGTVFICLSCLPIFIFMVYAAFAPVMDKGIIYVCRFFLAILLVIAIGATWDFLLDKAKQVDDNTPLEHIVLAAIKRISDGKIWVGKRHHLIIHDIFVETGASVGADYEQGFVTNSGRYVGRIKARAIAKEADQIKWPLSHNPRELFSEEIIPL